MAVELAGFAENLNRLSTSSTVRYSHVELARRLTGLGCPTTAAWVQQAREGKQRNPSAARVAALALAFNVPAAYFFDPAVTDLVNARFDQSRTGLTT